MKKYLWIITILSLSIVNTYGEENPFALQENFQKIDRNTDDLLDSLKKIHNKIREERQSLTPVKVVIEESFDVEKNTTDSNITDVNITDINTTDMNVSEEEQAKKDNELAMKRLIEEEKNKEIEEEKIRLEKVKKEQARIKKEKEKLAQLEKEKQEKQEEKKKEKERQELIKEEKVKMKSIETKNNIVDINLSKEKLELTKKIDQEYLEAIEVVDAKKVETKVQGKEKSIKITKKVEKEKQESKYDTVDINTTKEELEAIQDADKIYLEAIKEVSGR